MAEDGAHGYGASLTDRWDLHDRQLVITERLAAGLPTGVEIRVLEIEVSVLLVGYGRLDLTLGLGQRSEQLVVRRLNGGVYCRVDEILQDLLTHVAGHWWVDLVGRLFFRHYSSSRLLLMNSSTWISDATASSMI